MTALWSTEAFAAAAEGRIVGHPPPEIAGVSIDSRSIGRGDAFVAIRGDTHDGHAFVAPALAAGAALALVSEGHVAEASGPLLVVRDDPLDALRRIAITSRARMAGSAVAVTGSVGKTGTKEMLRLALSRVGATHAPVASFNNHWGVPLTLARMPASTRFGVFEIGMNHPGEITPLTRMVRPHVAIVTTVESVHRAFFPSVAEIAEAKAEIFAGLLPGGRAVLNRDNAWFSLLSGRARDAGAKIISFGEHEASDVRLLSVRADETGSEIELSLLGEQFGFRLGAPGRHLAQNSLAVAAALHALGIDLPEALNGLAHFSAPKGRGERLRLQHPAGPFVLIDESYNANPASMRAALALLQQAEPVGAGRRIAVLGDMLELGEAGPPDHLALAEVVDRSADVAFVAGPLMAELWRDLPDRRRGAYAGSAAELEPILMSAIGPGDVIMIKASLGSRFGSLVESVKRRYAAAGAS